MVRGLDPISPSLKMQKSASNEEKKSRVSSYLSKAFQSKNCFTKEKFQPMIYLHIITCIFPRDTLGDETLYKEGGIPGAPLVDMMADAGIAPAADPEAQI